ncbi:MAG TPA: alpha-galactosidase, partial [Vicinamibacteria bacterium]|nr:alpha-galactosidase [Vicinamibacteria bacterium]
MIALALLLSLVRVDGDGVRLEFDERMRSRVVATFAGVTVLGGFSESEVLLTASGESGGFLFQSRAEDAVTDVLGEGRRVTLVGHAGSLGKRVEVTAYQGRPRFLFVDVRYTNDGRTPIDVRGYTSHRYAFQPAPGGAEPAFWSYQGASYESRPDWVLPVPAGFSRDNFLGMNASDYGGGTPVVDVWRRDLGLAIGHLELVPRLVSLPVRRQGAGEVELALAVKKSTSLAPGESLSALRSFVAVHRGDMWETLRAYAGMMQAQGLVVPRAPASAKEPIWCAWGYGRAFTPQQVFET